VSANGNGSGRRLDLSAAVASRRRAQLVAGLRDLARAPGGPPPSGGHDTTTELCDLCHRGVPDDHRHLLDLHQRLILCACESCWAMRSGDPGLRPVGARTAWLDDFVLPDDVWASFQVPIGLAFFLYSSVVDCVVALYPSPAGATESELRFDSWERLRKLNPVLDQLEPDAEALIVNRLSAPPSFVIAPIDRCYMLVGLIKASWEGISGGAEVERAVARFFDDMRSRDVTA
jgi:hypothetical protein